MKFLRYTAINVLFVVLIYLALFEKMSGAENLLIFMIWLLFIVTSLSSTDGGFKIFMDSISKPGKLPAVMTFYPVKKFDRLLDIAIVGTLIWHSWWWMGILYLIHGLQSATLYDKAEKFVKEGRVVWESTDAATDQADKESA